MVKQLWNRFFYSLTVRGILHFLAMNAPHNKLRVPLYRLRGTKIGRDVFIGPGTFIEEARPELIELEDGVNIAPQVTIISHDSSSHVVDPDSPVVRKKVLLKKNSFIGSRSVILPGVTIGESSIIGAGSVVAKDIPPGHVALGVPARVIKSIEKK